MNTNPKPEDIKVILATDCGSTTTKAILIEYREGEYRLIVRGEAPTTVEAPFEDVTMGVLNAVGEVVSALGRSGRAALRNHPAAELVAQLEAVVGAGLTRAETELGHRIGLPSLPRTIGMLVEAWAQGNVAQLDPNNANFQKLFSELAGKTFLGRFAGLEFSAGEFPKPSQV